MFTQLQEQINNLKNITGFDDFQTQHTQIFNLVRRNHREGKISDIELGKLTRFLTKVMDEKMYEGNTTSSPTYILDYYVNLINRGRKVESDEFILNKFTLKEVTSVRKLCEAFLRDFNSNEIIKHYVTLAYRTYYDLEPVYGHQIAEHGGLQLLEPLYREEIVDFRKYQDLIGFFKSKIKSGNGGKA